MGPNRNSYHYVAATLVAVALSTLLVKVKVRVRACQVVLLLVGEGLLTDV
jgi:hypothetical protein